MLSTLFIVYHVWHDVHLYVFGSGLHVLLDKRLYGWNDVHTALSTALLLLYHAALSNQLV